MNILPIALGLGALALLTGLGTKKAAAKGTGAGEPGKSVSDGAKGAGGAAAREASKNDNSAAIEAARKIIANAPEMLGRGDPDEIDAAADKVAPWEPDVARDWHAFAKLIRDSRGRGTEAPVVVNVPSQPKGSVPVVVPDSEPVSAASKSLAAKFALMLQTTKAGKEDKSVVKLFQTDNGLKADGFYGRQTAVMLARKYGIVPPRPPVSWGTAAGGYKSVAPDKQLYRQAMLDLAKTDAARADEWTMAASAAR